MKTKLSKKGYIRVPRPLNPIEREKAKRHPHYKVAMMVKEHFGRDMTGHEIAQKCNCAPSLVSGMANFLRQNGVDIPHGIHSMKTTARMIALEDILKTEGKEPKKS